MAGCFGNHPVDRYLEGQLNQYLREDEGYINRLKQHRDNSKFLQGNWKPEKSRLEADINMTNRAKIEKVIAELKAINSVEKEDFIGSAIELLQDGIDDENPDEDDSDVELDLEGDLEDSEREEEEFDECI